MSLLCLVSAYAHVCTCEYMYMCVRGHQHQPGIRRDQPVKHVIRQGVAFIFGILHVRQVKLTKSVIDIQ